MAKNANWHDDYWLLLMQIYLRKPIGIKPLYSRPMVDLSLELHIPPQFLFARMCEIANLETPRIERLWETYSGNKGRLTRAISLLRSMKGFGQEDSFYEGVELNETFERNFRPLPEDSRFTPVMLVLILDLYFRLTPITMVPETPEVQELARLLKISPDEVTEVLDVFQHCDPYLSRHDVVFNRLLLPCQHVWQHYGNADTRSLSSYAEQLKEYYK